MPLVLERAVLRVQGGKEAIDGGEERGQERELRQGPELAHAGRFHRFLPATLGLGAWAKTSR